MSSRSQSSGHSSSSRRGSSRGRKSSGPKKIVKKTVAQHGINFWFMFAGFVCGLTVLLLVVSLFAPDRINPELLAANDENRAEIATRVEEEDFDTFVGNAKVDRLVETLASLQEVRDFRVDGSFLANFERQQKIIDAMLAKPLSEEYRQLAILANIKSTSTAFWNNEVKPLGVADLGIQLREIVEMHQDDSEPTIAFEARVELARLNSLEAADRAVAHSRELYQLLVDFPADKRVHKTITDTLARLVASANDRGATTKVLDHFLKQPKVAGNQDTQKLYGLLTDLWTLCDLDFFGAKENLLYTAKAGREQLRDVCLDLAEVPTAGIEIMRHLNKIAQWMEAHGHYSYAIEIYEALRKSSLRLDDKEVVARLQQYANWGSRRCNAVGKPFNLAAKTFDGEPLNLGIIESMPVLILFWSKSDKTESLLYSIEKASGRWPRNSVKILTVQVEKDASNFDEASTQQKQEHFEHWGFFYDDGRGAGPFFAQVPAEKNGRMVLLDRQHKLYDVEVALDELVTTVNSVLAIRSLGTEE